MSWLAKYFKSLGFKVSGSDSRQSNTLKMLSEQGINTFVGHNESNLDGVQVVVYSDAINEDNPELKRAREQGLYVLSRGEALRSVAENFGDVVGVSGCHGKTTTTCMLAHIFKCACMSFTAHIGGEDSVFGNFINDGSDLFLSEVCEFKKNINKFDADYAVCLNVGKDHMDCYQSEEDLQSVYYNFAKRGYKSIINKCDKFLSTANLDNSITFSIGEGGDYQAKDLYLKNGKYSFNLYKGNEIKGKIELSVYGYCNVENALAASVCAMQLGVDFRHVKNGLKNFKGVVRRFEEIGKIHGCNVIADYAHHPTEITACLKTATEVCKGEVYVVFQPHTYSRTVYLKDEFVKVLENVKNLALFKTFSARENYINGGSAYDLHVLLGNSLYFESVDIMLDYYKKVLSKKDMLLILGAGDLYNEVKESI